MNQLNQNINFYNGHYPLYNVYNRLREEFDFSLGVDDYYSLINALSSGYGIENIESLKRLCKSLWVKSKNEVVIFERVFEDEFLYSQLDLKNNLNLDISVPSSQQFDVIKKDSLKKFKFILILIGLLIVNLFWLLPRPRSWLEKSVFKITPSSLPSLTSRSTSDNRIFDSDISQVNSLEDTSRMNISENTSTLDLLEDADTSSSNVPEHNFDSNSSQEYPIKVEHQNFYLLFQNPIFQLIGFNVCFSLLVFFIWYFKFNLENQDRQSNNLDRSDCENINIANDDSLENNKNKGNNILFEKKSYENYFKNSKNNFYLNLNRRQLNQIWRQVRYSEKQSFKNEIDLKNTIQKIGKRGFFSEPVYTLSRSNKAKFLFLADREGSMMTFHDLTDFLIKTAFEGEFIKDGGTFYFRNCPIKDVYSDPFHQNAVPIKNVFNLINPIYSAVVIISDAGAMRRNFNHNRVKKTIEFINHLKKYTHHFIWLNPTPIDRWKDSSAELISESICMFPIDKNGLKSAIRELCSN